jgi:hypothetical protein
MAWMRYKVSTKIFELADAPTNPESSFSVLPLNASVLTEGTVAVARVPNAAGDVTGPYSALVVGNDSHTHGDSTIDGLNASATTAGTFAAARIPDAAGDVTGSYASLVVGNDSHTHGDSTIDGLNTSAVTAGTFANARIAASNVTQHVASIDHDSLLNFAAGEHFTQAAITVVGTIATGVWQGTAVANSYVAALPTSKITSGTFADARIAASNVTQHQASLALAASQTTSGAFADARIPSLATSKITSGTFAIARMPTGGTWAISSDLGITGGDVAIGHASPGYILSVGVDTTLTGLASFAVEGGTNATVNFSRACSNADSPNISFSKSRGTHSSPSNDTDGDGFGTINFGGYLNGFKTRASIYAKLNGSPGGSSLPTDLIFATGTTSLTERMRIKSDGMLLIPGDIGDTSNRVNKIWTVHQDTTNAENVSSWGAVKDNILPYIPSALNILRGVKVVTFQHDDRLDSSRRIKLGILAESIAEPLATPYKVYPFDYGIGPGVDMMGLAALNIRALQELDKRLELLEAA